MWLRSGTKWTTSAGWKASFPCRPQRHVAVPTSRRIRKRSRWEWVARPARRAALSPTPATFLDNVVCRVALKFVTSSRRRSDPKFDCGSSSSNGSLMGVAVVWMIAIAAESFEDNRFRLPPRSWEVTKVQQTGIPRCIKLNGNQLKHGIAEHGRLILHLTFRIQLSMQTSPLDCTSVVKKSDGDL